MTCSMCHGAHDWDIACPPLPKEPRSRSFEAKFPGRCVDCREPIEVGDLITYDGAAVAHEGCNP